MESSQFFFFRGSPENQTLRKEIPLQEPSFSGFQVGSKSSHSPLWCSMKKDSLQKPDYTVCVCFMYMFWGHTVSILAPLEQVFTIPHVQTVKQSVLSIDILQKKKTFITPTLLPKTSRNSGYNSVFMINTD